MFLGKFRDEWWDALLKYVCVDNCAHLPTCRSGESVESLSRGATASPCSPGPLRPPQTRDAQEEFIMMAPEEKLKYLDSRAQAHEDNQEVGAGTHSYARNYCCCCCWSWRKGLMYISILDFVIFEVLNVRGTQETWSCVNLSALAIDFSYKYQWIVENSSLFLFDQTQIYCFYNDIIHRKAINHCPLFLHHKHSLHNQIHS